MEDLQPRPQVPRSRPLSDLLAQGPKERGEEWFVQMRTLQLLACFAFSLRTRSASISAWRALIG